MVAKSFWIVIEQGVEYNDSTYEIAGGAKVAGNAFATEFDADREARKRLKSILSGFRLADFDEGYGYFNIKGHSEVIDEYFASLGIEAQESYGRMYYKGAWDLKWDEFIEWCEERLYSWSFYAPELVTVQEIKA